MEQYILRSTSNSNATSESIDVADESIAINNQTIILPGFKAF
jgi:hypothetical protein